MSSALETLRRDFGGDIIEPGGAEYESASRSVLASGNPAYVLRPRSVGDVQAGVRFAASAGLLLSVRGGGHGFPGFGTNEGGVVIDPSMLANVEVIDNERHLVRIGGGATWGQVAAALAPHGLAISSGDTKSVGVGGLTLTGGIGWKVRKYGLALDNVVAAEVVTATGEVAHASAEENPELFWAIRGGGGNFGIVTAFEFAAHPTTHIFHGKIAFPASEAASVLQGWADYLRAAPEELTSIADFGPEAPVEIYVAFDGDAPELAVKAIDPIRRLGTVASSFGSDLGKTHTSRQRRLRKLPRFCHRGGCRRDLSNGNLSAPRSGQASIRPWQSVRPQPQRPTSIGLAPQAATAAHICCGAAVSAEKLCGVSVACRVMESTALHLPVATPVWFDRRRDGMAAARLPAPGTR
jgi:FAD/FMN-containing dehydrogenase